MTHTNHISPGPCDIQRKFTVYLVGLFPNSTLYELYAETHRMPHYSGIDSVFSFGRHLAEARLAGLVRASRKKRKCAVLGTDWPTWSVVEGGGK